MKKIIYLILSCVLCSSSSTNTLQALNNSMKAQPQIQNSESISELYRKAKATENKYRAGNTEKQKDVIEAYENVYNQLKSDTVEDNLLYFYSADNIDAQSEFYILKSIFKVASYKHNTELLLRLFATYKGNEMTDEILQSITKRSLKGADIAALYPRIKYESNAPQILGYVAGALGKAILHSESLDINNLYDALEFFKIQKEHDQGATASWHIAVIQAIINRQDNDTVTKKAVEKAVKNALKRLMTLSKNIDQTSQHMLQTSLFSISSVSKFRMWFAHDNYEHYAFLPDCNTASRPERYEAMLWHAVASHIETLGEKFKDDTLRYACKDHALWIREKHRDVIEGARYIPGLCSLHWDDAGRDIDQLCENSKDDASDSFICGQILQYNGDIEKAITCYKQAAEQNYTRAQYQLGYIYGKEKHDIEQSIDWYIKVLSQNNGKHLKEQARAQLYFWWDRISFNGQYYVYKGQTDKDQTDEKRNKERRLNFGRQTLEALKKEGIIEKVYDYYTIHIGNAINCWCQQVDRNDLQDAKNKLRYRFKCVRKYQNGLYQYQYSYDQEPFQLDDTMLKMLEDKCNIWPYGNRFRVQ